MSRLFWLTEEQVERITPFFPKERGVGRSDDRRVLSGIIYVIKNGLQWVDAPADYGPHKTLYNRFKRGRKMVCSSASSRKWPSRRTRRKMS